jgi:hypothetical protein
MKQKRELNTSSIRTARKKDKDNSNMGQDSATITDDQESIERSINKLNDNVEKVKYSDFTKKDKETFLEIFVNHQATLNLIHEAIF